jgi:hypothetical protein
MYASKVSETICQGFENVPLNTQAVSRKHGGAPSPHRMTSVSFVKMSSEGFMNQEHVGGFPLLVSHTQPW